MKISFSTLACPDRTMPQIIEMAARAGYDGIELRFVEGEDSLWKLAAFTGAGLATTKRELADRGLSIPCVDTSCHFHSADKEERSRWIAEGERMGDLAAELGAPGIRVFGDEIQAGTDRASTRTWIAESIRKLGERSGPKAVEVWLESHGDFSAAVETAAILSEADSAHAGVVWDPVNSFTLCNEEPAMGAAVLGARIRHVHVKDVRRHPEGWSYALTGEGSFPLGNLESALRQLRYDRFLSFEWEKRWHPEIEEAEVALPHFVNWFRKSYGHG